MAITLEMTYGKKVGLPEFSSHNFNVSLKAEVTELTQIEAEVERVYNILQDAVDKQIVNPGFVPGQNGGNGSHAANGNHWKCSEKQRDLILKLVDEHRLDRGDVDELARQRFEKGVTGLNKLEASGLIDELIETYANKRRGKGRRIPAETRRVA